MLLKISLRCQKLIFKKHFVIIVVIVKPNIFCSAFQASSSRFAHVIFVNPSADLDGRPGLLSLVWM